MSQDHFGFIWVGTNNGLYRFDGENFFNVSYQDKEFYVNVDNLLVYKESVYIITTDEEYYQVNVHNLVCSRINLDKIPDEKLVALLVKAKEPKVEFIDENTFRLSDNGKFMVNTREELGTYNTIFKDSHNNLWVSNANGSIGQWNTQEQQINYVSSENSVMSVQRFVEDKKNRVWFSFRRNDQTEFNSGGIGFWDLNQKKVFTLQNIKQHPYINDLGDVFATLYDFEITTLFFDKFGNLWVGTATKGVFRVRFKKRVYQFLKIEEADQQKVTNEDISHPSVLKNGDVWIGTWGAGVNVLKKRNLLLNDPPFEEIPVLRNLPDALKDSEVYPIFEDSKENVWIGTATQGLFMLSKTNKMSRHYNIKNYNLDNSKLLSNSIEGIYETKEGKIWITTNKGLVSYNPKNKQFNNSFKELKIPNIFHDIWTFSVFQDSQNNLWVTTQDHGLYKWNRKENTVTNIKTIKGYSANNILSIVETHKNSIWFAGFNGLFKYNLNNSFFEFKVPTENFVTDHIASMALGEDKRLWLGTRRGLCVYDPVSRKVEKINFTIGLRRNSFTRGMSQDNNGYLYFGTRNGFYKFHPLSYSLQEKNVPLKFTNLKIKGVNYIDFKKSNNISNNIVVSNSNNLELQYSNNSFSLVYSPLDFALEDVNYYETSMTKEGEESYWSSTTNNATSWVNLGVGNYTFKVRNRNSDLESVMHITILPPWWQTYWFQIAFVLSLILIAYVIIKTIFNREQYKRTIEFEKRSLKAQIDLDNQQLHFFTNLSHEIRTPLTLILSPLEEIMKSASKDYNITNLELIKKSVLRITRLVNRGIDFRKTEFKKFELEAQELDIVSFLSPLIKDFGIFSAGKNIELVFKHNQEKILFWFDQYMMESIIYNLLSNAIKYSYPNGKVILELKEQNNHVLIKVKDYGRGINEKDLESLFDRFYQAKDHVKGSGIGLALVKRFIDAHKATINVKSVVEKGSCFELQFPLGDSHIPDELKKDTDNKLVIAENNKLETENVPRKEIYIKHLNYTVLIVEDETDLREYLETNLSLVYKTITAENGVNALDIVKKNKIDIIISDVMMPKMDGLELCETLKNNPQTNNIPIVLLTAKTLNTDRITGFDKGADAYIDKPFSLNVLKSRIANILENQTRATNNFLELLNVDVNINSVNDSDKEFYNKTLTILESHIGNPNFDIPLFAKEMGMSKSVIYKRMSSITDIGINDLMLKLRLNRASYLLTNTSKPIVEIAFLIGFKDAKYFSKCFKKEFKETPSAFRSSQESQEAIVTIK
ncbi:response regulator [Sabulilitoribacter arenilitoris]|uniref:histidine kinase n=1 Tax=Wocania arenilitoris TaxID=2044858 RepID=A0AAE3EQA4_9FLAO|nr:response regulator [Wocania arenilitoris]